jgi:hypothetical protein
MICAEFPSKQSIKTQVGTQETHDRHARKAHVTTSPNYLSYPSQFF